MMPDCSVVLVPSGGNALGAYQGGVYQALVERGIAIDWLVGASTGAINGSIICGNAPAQGVERLRDYWQTRADVTGVWRGIAEDARGTLAAQRALLAGQWQTFVPRHLLGPWWEPFGNREPSSLYDTSPLEITLGKLVDFDRLNAGTPRFW